MDRPVHPERTDEAAFVSQYVQLVSEWSITENGLLFGKESLPKSRRWLLYAMINSV